MPGLYDLQAEAQGRYAVQDQYANMPVQQPRLGLAEDSRTTDF